MKGDDDDEDVEDDEDDGMGEAEVCCWSREDSVDGGSWDNCDGGGGEEADEASVKEDDDDEDDDDDDDDDDVDDEDDKFWIEKRALLVPLTTFVDGWVNGASQIGLKPFCDAAAAAAANNNDELFLLLTPFLDVFFLLELVVVVESSSFLRLSPCWDWRLFSAVAAATRDSIVGATNEWPPPPPMDSADGDDDMKFDGLSIFSEHLLLPTSTSEWLLLLAVDCFTELGEFST